MRYTALDFPIVTTGAGLTGWHSQYGTHIAYCAFLQFLADNHDMLTMLKLIKGRLNVYAAGVFAFLLAPVFGFTGWNLTFWFTLATTLAVVACLDFLVHKALHKTQAPSHFLLFMFGLVISTHILFSAIYHYTATGANYLTGSSRHFWDAFYFSGVTLFTVGYGDIVPIGDFRFVSVVQIYLGHLLIFTAVAWGLGHFASQRLYKP